METREWNHIVNKGLWGRGEWDNEPDKLQFTDEATGLPCLILRNNSVTGALCGYVGIPESHPAFGLSYDGSTQEAHDNYHEAIRKKWRKDYDAKKAGLETVEELVSIEPPPVIQPIGELIANIKVHGGLTFSGGCSEPTEEQFKEMQQQLDYHLRQAKLYPKGDSAQWVDTWAWCLNNYGNWKNQWESMSICHTGGEKVWWFGFDCAHCMDLSPKLEAMMHSVSPGPPMPKPEGYPKETYKNIAYVKNECASLAQQLKAIEQIPK